MSATSIECKSPKAPRGSKRRRGYREVIDELSAASSKNARGGRLCHWWGTRFAHQEIVELCEMRGPDLPAF